MSWSSLVGSLMASAGGNLALGAWDGGWSTYSSGQSKLKDQLRRSVDAQKQIETWQAKELPALSRAGYEAAGYNPLLAIGGTNFATGASLGGGSFPESQTGSAQLKLGNLLDVKSRMADIDVKKASAERIRSEVGVDAWRPVSVSRSEALGLGANLLGQLGLNLSRNKAESFTLFYNPITKELRNPFTGYGANADHAGSAQDVHDNKANVNLFENNNGGFGSKFLNQFLQDHKGESF